MDVNKAIAPVECKRKAPINANQNWTTGNYIQWFIGPSDASMWLVNDSYIKLNLKVPSHTIQVTTAAGHGAVAANKLSINSSYIKNAANIFDKIEILYASKVIYHEEHFIEANALEQLYLGEDYQKANPQTYTTRKMVQDTEYPVHLELLNTGTHAAIAATDPAASIPVTVAEQTITDILVPVNKLMPIFQDLTSEGFPLFTLQAPIELRLYVADPYKYIVDWNGNDFTYGTKCNDANISITPDYANNALSKRFASDSVQINSVDLYMMHYIPNESERAIISQKVNGEGMKFRYRMIKTAFRQATITAGTQNSIPFTLNTSNVNALMLYAHMVGQSPNLMLRPNLSSLYIQFGANQLPKQPIPNSSWQYPYDYKFTVDDVLNNIDTYYSQSNFDFNNSYLYKKDAASTVPTSSFVMLGANYVSDPDDFGADSKAWQGQYQVHFKSDDAANTENVNFVLAVVTEYGMLLKNGDLDTKNI